MSEADRRLPGQDAPGRALDGVLDGVLDRVLGVRAAQDVVPGWATVELERAAEELPRRFAHLGPGRLSPSSGDELLGARSSLLRFEGGTLVVLLEPATEGPLAASLARLGEGWLARYLVVDGHAASRLVAAGVTLSAEGDGPLGRQRRVLVGPAWGPHLLLVAPDGFRPGATIEP